MPEISETEKVEINIATRSRTYVTSGGALASVDIVDGDLISVRGPKIIF